MITLIKVDGFKSLRDFSLSLREGLNVLVGPNGAGKTNIVLFLEFLSSCVDRGVSRTVSHFGGAGSLFRKVGEYSYVSKISSTVYGSVQINGEFIYYEFLFDISLTEAGDSIYISRQSIKLKIGDSHTEGKIQEVDAKFDIELDLISRDTTKYQLETFKPSEALNKRLKFLRDITIEDRAESNKVPKEFTIASLFSTDKFFISNSFIMDEHFLILEQELRGSAIYNFNPEAIRKPDDGVSEPGIKTDGSGLYSTLYAIDSNTSSNQFERFPFIEDRYRRIPRKLKMEEVIDHIRLANDSIKEISVENDTFNKQLQIRVTVSGSEDEDEDAILPLSLLSDGTVKWISLVTLILTNSSIACIEEPENFLHPRMQSIFIEIIRDSQAIQRSSIILTTHSESLLNSLSPEEVICVEYENGRTIASRPLNMDAIQNEMNRTGFGLGYYYTTDELEI